MSKDQAATERELGWLLAQSIPESVDYVHKHIAQLSLLAPTPKANGVASANRESQVELREDVSAEVSGSATISGALVTQLSFTTVAFGQLGQGKPVQFYLKKGEFISLRQAQDAQSYARSALRKAQNLPAFESHDEAHNYVDALLRDIQHVKGVLASEKQQGLMPLQSENTEKFVPVLPENIVVECSIEGSDFVVRVYWLNFRRGIKGASILDAFKKDQNTGHMLIHNGRLAEVKREIVLRAPLDDVACGLASLDSAAGICTDIIGQLHAFDSV
ncbi:hypothetical protein LPJ66_009481 [Kickxella alabastrina]|uniref:Uncharacterized protein n=1 Tax=Kickxella alabastrina TaxID=61397 RepID=A0ACC1I3U2_9FUNG|nr:hypothetical protein LPJ66_009481 [Kickxella alabastrina]